MYLSSLFCLNSRIVYLTFATKSRYFAKFAKNPAKQKGGTLCTSANHIFISSAVLLLQQVSCLMLTCLQVILQLCPMWRTHESGFRFRCICPHAICCFCSIRKTVYLQALQMKGLMNLYHTFLTAHTRPEPNFC